MTQSLWKGIMFSASLFLSCFFGTLVLLTPLIPIALKWPSLGRRMMDFSLWLWFVFAAVSLIFFIMVLFLEVGEGDGGVGRM